jgi:AraC-like DNA-binding protein
MAWETWMSALAQGPCDLLIGRVDLPRDELGPRTLDLHVLFLVLGGSYQVTVDGAPARAQAGDLIWLPAGLPHHVRSQGPVRKYFMRLHLPAGRPAGEPPVRRLGDEAAVWCSALLAEQTFVDADRPGRVRALLHLLFSAWRRSGSTPPGGLDPERRAQLWRLVQADPARRWTRDELGAAIGISGLHLARQARRAFGMPLRRWLVETRIRAAARELREHADAVGAVAARYGYADLFLFSRQFRDVMGISPRVWRQ